MLHQASALPVCTVPLCQALPVGDYDFSASVSVSASEVSTKVPRRERVIPDLERLPWVASKREWEGVTQRSHCRLALAVRSGYISLIASTSL